MQILFDDRVAVQYGFLFLASDEGDAPDFDDSRVGQTNGLLGAADPRGITMVTATHTGEIAIRIEWHAAQPVVDPQWTDVVEASTQFAHSQVTLSTFDETVPIELPGAGPCRARYCADGMEAAADEGTVDDGAVAPDRYLLQLWPAARTHDGILRLTSNAAAYWHEEAAQSAAHTEATTSPDNEDKSLIDRSD